MTPILIKLSGLLLFILPFPGSVLCRSPANLFDMTTGPLLLMLLLSAFKIICNTAMNDLVSLLVVVFVSVSFLSHVSLLRLTSEHTSIKEYMRCGGRDGFCKRP